MLPAFDDAAGDPAIGMAAGAPVGDAAGKGACAGDKAAFGDTGDAAASIVVAIFSGGGYVFLIMFVLLIHLLLFIFV